MKKIGIIFFITLFISTNLSAGEYQLRPGDSILIKIANHAELSSDLRIPPDGDISLPLVGKLQASGKTTNQLTEELTASYARFLKKPIVSITVKDYKERTIYVLGMVNRPGPLPLPEKQTLLSVIAAAGDVKDGADSGRVSLTRKSGESIIIDLNSVMNNPNLDVPVGPDDVILVPENTQKLYILGSVIKPGTYDYKPGLKVLDALKMADGLSIDADSNGAVLTKPNGMQIPVNIKSIMQNGQLESNIALEAGDALFIPKQTRKFSVFGYVERPGQFPINGGERVLDAILMAGGTNDLADTADIGVIRVVDGVPQVLTANLNLYKKTGDMKQNIELKEGDVVYVAQKKKKEGWNNILSSLWSANLLTGIVKAIW